MATFVRSIPNAWQSLKSSFCLAPSNYSTLPFIPRPLKWLFLLILLINVRGFPFLWHIRLFRPAIYARIYHAVRDLLETDQQRMSRLARVSPVGKNPFTVETVFKTRATPDVCDFNMHLSNSSYAMTFDMVRFKYVVEHMPFLYGDGGWIAVGGTYYSFIREIPLNASYEIRLSVASWDHKWVYMVARYVTYTIDSKKALERFEKRKSTTLALPDIILQGPQVTSPAQSPALETEPSWIGAPLPDGAVLHCTAISRLCSKIGRITIPPSVVISTAGFGIPRARFDEILSWRLTDKGKRIKKFYAGGWKEIPENERWWEDALGGEIEARRVQALHGLPGSIGVPVGE